MSKPSILSCGEVLWDLFPEGARFGGAPANFACHAALLGGDVSMLSAVGNDERGDEAVQILHRLGVETSLVQRHASKQTGSVGISLDGAGKPSFEIHAGSAWDHIVWSVALESKLGALDAIYFGSLGQRGETSRATIRRALDLAMQRGILRVLDVNLRQPFYDAALIRDSVALASVLKLSDDEYATVTAACGIAETGNCEQTLRHLLDAFDLDCVVMTRGSEGALLLTANVVVHQPGFPTLVVDTVGAGDSFTAALIIGLLRGDALPIIALQACEIAAKVCAHHGAVQYPEIVNSTHSS